ncbi:Uma2 family endonuclease [Leptolyngbya sp. PCC 6406]|uniref:Uma2 family endonuclease n=1 Tax=Leptolyngbya sp. PCC 6406 TaxID=1173264 RepID=UPI0002AC1333|nr:Uma2 family endonuclease [Leptolyngbya sp. PCC 6406]
MSPLVVAIPPSTRLSDRQFYDLCQANPDLKIERTAEGDLLFIPPTGGETGNRNAKLISRFVVWSEETQQGEVFDSSTGFKLPNGADRSPDVAWVRRDRWEALPPEAREKFPPIAPDFVLELMSPSDGLAIAQAKMREYIDNGVRLGWLINRSARQVEIYRPEQPVEILTSPVTLTGEAVLPGFTLTLGAVWW